MKLVIQQLDKDNKFWYICKNMKSIGYYLIKGITRPLAILPLGFHRAAGRFVGWLAGSVIGYRKDVVITNLSRSFPDKSYEEIKDICKKFYRHFGNIVAEAMWYGGGSIGRVRKSHIVEIENIDTINRAYEENGSVFVLMGHVGNWELIAGYVNYAYGTPLSADENDLSVVYRKVSSRAWDEFMNGNRLCHIIDKKHYDGVVETFNIMRYIFNHKSDKKIYSFITDQYPYARTDKTPKITFLGRETYTMDGAAAIARKMKLPVLYMGMPQTAEGGYKMRFKVITKDASSMDAADIMQRFYDLLEADLKEQPWNYLWTHKRWK